MTIDEQLRGFARRADQLQRVITADEVAQRASNHSPGRFTRNSQHVDDRTFVDKPVQPTEEGPMIDLEIPSPTDEHRPGPRRVVVAALLAAAAVITLAVIVTRSNEDTSPADDPTPTVVPDSVPAMSDSEVIQAGVDAFYSGDADRAAELFELADRTDDQIRAESAYQAAIGGRLDPSCTATEPGSFRCLTPYRNAMTDAVGMNGGNDIWPVMVQDGVITQFGFTEHTSVLLDMATFLASEDRFDGYENCVSGPFDESCATIQLENLDAWATWLDTVKPADRVEIVLRSWYRGDCAAAVALSWDTPIDCSAASLPAQMVAYESILDAQVSVANCATTPQGNHSSVTCDVHYSNAMHTAVGKPPSVNAHEFLLMFGIMPAAADEGIWFQTDYPQDAELHDSFKRFVEEGALAAEFADAGCATARSSECANLIVANLDAWATWYQTNA